MKLENILLDCEGHVVLTDFGLSKEFVTEDVSLAASVSGSSLPWVVVVVVTMDTDILVFNRSGLQVVNVANEIKSGSLPPKHLDVVSRSS